MTAVAVRLFYCLAFTFALGIFARSFIQLGLSEVCWLLLLALAGALWWRRSGATIVFFGVVCLVGLAAGIFRYDIASWDEVIPTFETALNQEVTLTGLVSREPDVRESTIHVYLKTSDGLLLVTTDPYQDIAYGNVIRVTGRLEQPEAFETDLGRTFNYPGYLKAQGVSYRMSFATVEVLESGQGVLPMAYLLNVKHFFLRSIETYITEPQAGLGEGLLLGVKRALGDELSTIFRKTGIIHIVVLSGYNIALVVAFVIFVLGTFMPDRAVTIVGIGVIVGFALMVGLSATVVRASIMAALLLALKATGRTYELMRALVLAACGMLVFNPYLLAFDPGFQLSFLATFALITLATPIAERLTWIPTVGGVREFMTATLATQIFVTPFLLYQIGELSLVAVIVNVLVLPAVPIAMLATFVVAAIGLVWSGGASFVSVMAYVPLTYILQVATGFAQLPFAAITVPTFPFWVLVGAYILLGFMVYRFAKPKTEMTMPHWTIVLESEYRAELMGNPTPQPQPETETIPIFFR